MNSQNSVSGSSASRPMARVHKHSLVFLTLTSVALGLFSTVVAKALVQLIALVTNLSFYGRLSISPSSPAANHLGLAVALVPVAGGVIIGLMARFGSKAIRGHGIPEAMEQILQNGSRIAPRITLLKPISAAISIGTGGPFGAEGPIIATGGALGSVIGQFFSTTANERKTLLAAGAAAGMTAIFSTPVSAVLLAVELLLFEFNPRSFIPVAAACASAAAVRTYLFGLEPAFAMGEIHGAGGEALLALALLGGMIGVASAVVSRMVYWVEDQFERLPIHWMWWPALGGLAVGLIGILVPRTLGVGYDNIDDFLCGRLPLGFVAVLCLAKLVSWSISLGSGTSGGTLAPLLTIGAGLGALGAAALQGAFPQARIEIALGALVGMTAMFTGASRALLASVAFAFESTRQPEALPALLAGATCAYLASHLIMRNTIMTEKIVRRGVPIPSGYEADPFHCMVVSEVMSPVPPTIPASMTVGELAGRIAAHAPEVSRHQASLIVDEEGGLVGVITRSDLLRAVAAQLHDSPVSEAGTGSPIVAFANESVHEAFSRLVHHEIGRLPVVDPRNPQKPVGYLGRTQILEARSVAAKAELMREPGWLARLKET